MTGDSAFGHGDSAPARGSSTSFTGDSGLFQFLGAGLPPSPNLSLLGLGRSSRLIFVPSPHGCKVLHDKRKLSLQLGIVLNDITMPATRLSQDGQDIILVS